MSTSTLAHANFETFSVPMTATNKGFDSWYGYTIYQCDASLTGIIPSSCSISNTTWEVYFDKVKGQWDWVSVADYLSYYGYTTDPNKVEADYSMSNTSLSFLHKPNDIKKLTPCPSLRATVTYTCPLPPPACTKKTWYYDGDKDGKGDPFVTKYECNAPGSDWVLTAGDDCPAVAGTFVQTPLCKDQDGDGYPSDKSEAACLGTPKYMKCGWDPSESDPTDCNDNDPTINKQISYCYDADQDGFCEGVGDKISSVVQCPEPPPYIPTSTAKGVDCNDKQASLKGKETWCADWDGDGYCKGKQVDGKWVLESFDNCGNPGPTFKLATASKGIDQCDGTTPGWDQIQEQDKFCKDKDMDGFGDPDDCKMECFWDAKYANPQGWAAIHPSLLNSGYDCKGGDTPTDDPTTSGKNINPAMEWGVDCDGDSHVSELLVKKGCLQPTLAAPGCKYASVKPGATAVTQYVRLEGPEGKDLKKGDCNDIDYTEFDGALWITDADLDGWYDPARSISQCKKPKFADALSETIQCEDSPDPQCTEKAAKYTYQNAAVVGDTIKKGDCDDDDKNIEEIMYLFADQDADGFGDPLVSKIINCIDEPYVSDPDQEYDWVKRPDDLEPHVYSATMTEMLGTSWKSFLVSTQTPTYCLKQADQAICTQEAAFCYRQPGEVYSCLAPAFRGLYCPHFGTIAAKHEKYGPGPGFFPWYLDGKLPFGTALPIIRYDQFNAVVSPSQISYTDTHLMYRCLLPPNASIFAGEINAYFKVDDGTGVTQKYAVAHPIIFVDAQYKPLKGSFTQPTLVAVEGSDYVLSENLLMSAPIPTASIFSTDFQVFSKSVIKTANLVELVALSKGLQIRIPFRPKDDPATIQCVYKGDIVSYDKCDLRRPPLTQRKVENPNIKKMLQEPALILDIIFNQADSDKDGVTDIAEASLPGLPMTLAYMLPYDQHLTPIPVGNSLILKSEPTPNEKALWEAGRQRAHDQAAEVFARTEEVLANFDGITLPLTLDHWHLLIDKQETARLWMSLTPAVPTQSFLTLPVVPLMYLYGVNQIQESVDGVPLTFAGKIYVDIWSILDDFCTTQIGINKIANVILHEVLHTAIVIDPHAIPLDFVVNQPLESMPSEYEHLFISAITGEFIDEGMCGTAGATP